MALGVEGRLRLASILAATAAISWLFCTLWDLPVSRTLLLWNGWMFVITLTAAFVAMRIPQRDHSYVIFYAWMLGPLMCFSIIAAIQFGVSLGQNGLIGLISCLMFSAFFVVLFWEQAPHDLKTKIMLSQAHVFAMCGLLTLASAVPPCSALQFKLRLHLGLYWLATGVYAFCHSVGVFRSKALWVSLASWFASIVCTVILGALAWALQGIQTELGPQQHRDEAPTDLVWEDA